MNLLLARIRFDNVHVNLLLAKNKFGIVSLESSVCLPNIRPLVFVVSDKKFLIIFSPKIYF